VLAALESALAAVNPHTLISRHVRRRADRLLIDDEVIPYRDYDGIFVIGAGKASGAMAEALEKTLGDHLEGGLVVVPAGQQRPKLSRVETVVGAHPIPDKTSLNAAKQVVARVEKLSDRDLLICAISGGGSALLSLPLDPLTVKEKGEVVQSVMNSGATIDELNTIRKHLSAVKGGWLAKRSGAGRTVGLIISDVIGDRLDSIASGPISPDPTTFADAIQILERYGLLESIPRAAVEILRKGSSGGVAETPKASDACFRRVSYHILGNNRVACLSAQRYLRSMGIKTKILSSSVTGEARYLGAFIGSLAKESGRFGEPFRRPCAFVIGGETTVRVSGSGLGGRNQECAMACSREIDGVPGTAMASIGTDGIDGPTDAAGAIVDGTTISRSETLGLRFEEILAQNDSYRFFLPLNDLVMTGRTDTNVNDVAVVVLV